jgi:hypothetical protein
MMMSVFRQGGRSQQLDHLAVIELATDEETTQMILFSRLHGRSALVGLTDGQAIIKPLETGDEALSFEALLDTCLSLRDYRRLAEHKKTSTDDLPDYIFEADVIAQIDFQPTIQLRLRAKDDLAARNLLKALMGGKTPENAQFRERLMDAIAIQLFLSDNIDFVSPGLLKVTEAPDDAPAWEIIENTD